MVAVVGYLVAATASIACIWFLAGRRYRVARDLNGRLWDVSARHITIVSGLAGFAVTGIVLLVTLGRNLDDATSLSFTTLLTMFFVAYMGFFATSSLFANVPETEPGDGFDMTAGAFAGAAVTLYFVIVIGWLALVPMFETFGLESMADLAGWLLVVAISGGFGMVAQHLHRSGYASVRLVLLIPLTAAAATSIYAAVVAWSGSPSPDATLALTVTAAVLGAFGFVLLSTLPILVREPRTAPFMDRRGHYLVLAYVQGTLVMIGFLLLSVLGFA